jgi:hypothetical protein
VKLEQEAKAHVEGTRIKFYDELSQHVEELEKCIKRRLLLTHEKDKALEHLTACQLWAKHCAKRHGIR